MLRAPDTPQPADRTDRWELQEELASGASATVYRATGRTDGRQGALKLLRPGHDAQARARFAREAEALARLQHPRIPALLDRGALPDGTPWLVVALIEGHTLAEAQANDRDRLPLATIVEQLGDALVHAHARGVVHRDVSPRNIVLAEGGAYLVDFGLSRMDGEPDLTTTDAMLGTVAYAAPEQLAGGTCTPASDLYGLAACVFAALTGTPPHPGATPTEVIAHRLAGSRRELVARDPAALPVARLLEQALAEDAEQRPPDLRRWSSELADRIDALPPPAHQAFAAAHADRTSELRGAGAPPRRRRRWLAATGVVAVAGIGVAVAATWPAPPEASSLRAAGATVPLSAEWVLIGDGRDGVRRATDRSTGTTVSLRALGNHATSPGWATAPPQVAQHPKGGELIRWTRGPRTRVVLPSATQSMVLDCAGTDAGTRCASLASRSTVPGNAVAAPLGAFATATRSALRGATPNWQAARTDHRDDATLRALAARRAQAAGALRRAAAQHPAWRASVETSNAASALTSAAVAVRRHAARRTARTWRELVAADAHLRRQLAALGRLVALPTAGRLRARPAATPSVAAGAAPGASSSAEAADAAAPQAPAAPAQGDAAPGNERAPSSGGSAPEESVTEETPIVVGPAL